MAKRQSVAIGSQSGVVNQPHSGLPRFSSPTAAHTWLNGQLGQNWGSDISIVLASGLVVEFHALYFGESPVFWIEVVR